MALKQVVVSDISGQDVPEEQHARIVIEEHPLISGPVELDVSVDESSKLQTGKLELVHVTVHEPNQPVRRVVLDSKAFAAVLKGVDVEALLANARRVQVSAEKPASTRKPRGTGAPRGERVDYTAPDKFGQLHRGRVTDEEAAMVRDNPEQASKNRRAQGHDAINWTDPKERKRYNIV